MGEPADPQLPRRPEADPGRLSGCEPALPGDPAAFDPVWRQVLAFLQPGDDADLWFVAVRGMMIPMLRENRLDARQEPVLVALSAPACDGAGWSRHFYFDPTARPGDECVEAPAGPRRAVGTQMGAAVRMVIRAGPGPSAAVWLGWKRYGSLLHAQTRHRASRGDDGVWTIGPGVAMFPSEGPDPSAIPGDGSDDADLGG